MFDTCREMEDARLEATQIFAESAARKYPFIIAHMAVKGMMKHRGLEIPTDILAFTFKGECSDRQISNPLGVYGE